MAGQLWRYVDCKSCGHKWIATYWSRECPICGEEANGGFKDGEGDL